MHIDRAPSIGAQLVWEAQKQIFRLAMLCGLARTMQHRPPGRVGDRRIDQLFRLLPPGLSGGELASPRCCACPFWKSSTSLLKLSAPRWGFLQLQLVAGSGNARHGFRCRQTIVAKKTGRKLRGVSFRYPPRASGRFGQVHDWVSVARPEKRFTQAQAGN